MHSRQFILYAEDDPDDLYLVREAFEKHDHIEVVHALNGRMALDILEEFQAKGISPCLVILDINMPLMDGRQTLESIRSTAAFSEVPVVLFSTSSSPLDMLFAQKWRSELITKPLQFSQLDMLADTFLQKCSMNAEKELKRWCEMREDRWQRKEKQKERN